MSGRTFTRGFTPEQRAITRAASIDRQKQRPVAGRPTTAKTIQVEVTAEDIAAGVPADAYRCPIGRALTRAVGEECWVTTGWGRESTNDFGPGEPLPVDALKWRRAFDRHEPVKPFSFRVPA